MSAKRCHHCSDCKRKFIGQNNEFQLRRRIHMPSAYTVFYAEEDNTTHVMIGAKHPNCPNNGGQRALPGGRVDRKDRNNFDAARREFHEETLLDIPPPPPQGGFPNGLMAGGLPFSSSGRQFDGFYVAYIRMRNLADLTNIS